MKIQICLMLAVIMFSANLFADGTQPGGSGTFESPYQISTLNHLLWVSTNSSSWAAYFEQTQNIDASETATWNWNGSVYNGWSPIGNDYNGYFTGVYDGQGFTIDGIYINRTGEYNSALFGSVSGATISNLGVTNVDITGYGYIGGLAGYFRNASANNCYTTGSVTCVSGGTYIGGLIGQCFGGSVTVTNCYSSCTVASSGSQAAGGLIGEIWQEGTISECYATGAVSGTKGVGGFIGQVGYGTISNCYSRGNVSRISGSTETYLGGFCGWNIGGVTIQKCYSTGSVTYIGSTNPTDKGFVGYDEDGSFSNNFWDSETSEQSTGTGATGKTTSEMKLQSTFLNAGWSSSIWYMDAGINDGYPNLSGTTPLPVELSMLIAECRMNNVKLQWRTAIEMDNYGFEVERRAVVSDQSSVISAQWIKLGFVPGAGTSNSPKEYSFADSRLHAGRYAYRLKQVDVDGFFKYSQSVEVEVGGVPKVFSLSQNYPNPFNPTTKFEFRISNFELVKLSIFNLLGREVAVLVNEEKPAGRYSITWNAKGMSSGIYFYTFRAGGFRETKRMIFLK